MNPVLFRNTSKQNLNSGNRQLSQGLGPLTDCISCTVTQTTDGEDEAQLVYPVNGAQYDLLQDGYLLSMSREPGRPRQFYVIYRKTLGLDGTATIYARHISYGLQFMVVESGRITSTDNIRSYRMEGQLSWPDDIYSRSYLEFEFDGVTFPVLTLPTPMRLTEYFKLIAEQTGAVMEYDNFKVIFHASRGEDNGVTVRYGGNLLSAQQEYDTADNYNAVLPYWRDPSSDDIFPLGSAQFIVSQSLPDGQSRFPGQYLQKIVPLDLSAEFETQPSTAELTSAAQRWLSTNTPWTPFNSMTISFVPYDPDADPNQAAAQNLRLYDTVRVVISPMDTDVSVQVIKTVYNVLLDRYDSIEVGQPKVTLSDIYGGAVRSGTSSGSGGTESFDSPVQFNSSVAITGTDALFKVVELTASASGSSSSRNVSLNQAVSPGAGWTPIGIVGAYSSMTTFYIYRAYLNEGNAIIGARYTGDSSSSTSVTLRAYVLCLRTAL